MDELINEALSKKVWAVVGATQRKEKFGYKIYKALKDHGYEVYPVNSRYDEIDGEKCYPDLSSLPKIPEVVDLVISPGKSEESIREAAKLGCEYVWFQPGAESDEMINLSKDLGFKVISGVCAMFEAGRV
jgi:CoA binding domain.